MYEGHRVAIVVPCYRVATHVADVVHSLPTWVDDVVLVNDGSPDGLAEVLAGLQRGRSTTPVVHVVPHERNLGLAHAMRSGFARARQLHADIVVKMDGDGQMDAALLPRLLGPIVEGEADFTKGNRFYHRRFVRDMPGIRKVGNAALSFVAKLASGYWHVFDPSNGYLAVRGEVLDLIEPDNLGPGYFFEISFLLEAYLAGAVLLDVPMPARYSDEVSSLSPRRVLVDFPPRLVAATLRRFLVRYFVRDFSFVSLLLVAGLPLLVFGLVFGLWNWYAHSGTGVATPTGTIIVAVLPLLTGFQMVLQALAMDVASVPRHSQWRISSAARRAASRP